MLIILIRFAVAVGATLAASLFSSMKSLFFLALSVPVLAGPAAAQSGQPADADGQLRVSIELPRLSVAEYHEPYVAVWIADANEEVQANLAVWYMQGSGPEGEGATWLKDLRQWWRRAGRSMSVPVDGITSATRRPGAHELVVNAGDERLVALADGQYTLIVEAVREVGDRELLRLPFNWQAGEVADVIAQGAAELGGVRLHVSRPR